VESQRRPGAGSGDTQVLEKLHSIEAREDLAAKLEEEFDRELLIEAQARVRLRVNETTWEAFRLTALEGRSGTEAAAELKIKVATVFVFRGRVQKMLQEEIRKLDVTK
jgi:RNA polymerase sigma-70 factor (ECF subfamily)